jgi:hypothetical protein
MSNPVRSFPLAFLAASLMLLAAAGSALAGAVVVGTKGNEPVVTVGPPPARTIMVSALQHLYASTDGGASFDTVAVPPFAQVNLNTDSSINFDPDGRLYFSFDWPYAGSTAVCTTDGPMPSPTWTSNPSALPGGTDRMWVVAPTTSAAYAVTNEGLYETTFLTSTDRGFTWTARSVGQGLLEPQTGPLLSNPDHTRIFQPVKNGTLGFYVYDVTDVTKVQSGFVDTGVQGPLALPSAAFGHDGTLWASTETPNAAGGLDVRVLRSSDQGLTWTTLPAVDAVTSGTATFTWVSAGRAGHVGIVYYWAPQSGDPGSMTDAVWDARWAESFDADQANPHWRVVTLQKSVHTGILCVAASCMGAARYSGDFISSWIDDQDTPYATWMSDTSGPTGILFEKNPVQVAAVDGTAPPTRRWLSAAAPNPSRDGFTFRFGLPQAGEATVAILDVGGRRVRELLHGGFPAGVNEVRWDGRDDRGTVAPAGLYFAVLESGSEVLRRSIVALR